ncbi:MAG: hypothetical protein ABH885_06935 [Candidatus Omnitrophota bacterium]
MSNGENEGIISSIISEDLMNSFFSFIIYEFRNRVTVIRDSASLIKDGVLGNDRAAYVGTLDKLIKNADELNKRLEEVVNTGKLMEKTLAALIRK